MKIVKKILILLLIALVGIQFYRPAKNNAEYREVAAFEQETKPSKEVLTLLESKCYDCHSNKSTYPWYAEVAPISLWIGHHIEEGNEHFNVSKWETYSDKKKDHKLEELIEEVEEGEMPLKSYTLLHGNITDTEKQALLTWAQEARKTYKH
ncbi:heme-binding domain-containing protein [Aquimarina pacifica]|uniref:heme-binding domain-containing protein n=1 Tax=Aquimarina pacifica TaxID=1296415 RepID=UPI00046F849A|nr:heme-binding domain-containing protein [Aquimarina pacifica]